MTLAEASTFVVPLTKSAPEQIETLRASSSGKYLSASHPGLYEYTQTGRASQTTVKPTQTGRAIRFDEA